MDKDPFLFAVRFRTRELVTFNNLIPPAKPRPKYGPYDSNPYRNGRDQFPKKSKVNRQIKRQCSKSYVSTLRREDG
jgi:hypothetical protein